LTDSLIRLSIGVEDVEDLIQDLGFTRIKKMFWARTDEHGIDFIHFHRRGSSYGGPINFSADIRVHFGRREFVDASDTLALNGPTSDSPEARSGRYHLRFNAKTGSTFDRCVVDLDRIVREVGLPWLSSLSFSKESADSESIALSKKLLGIKTPKKSNRENKSE